MHRIVCYWFACVIAVAASTVAHADIILRAQTGIDTNLPGRLLPFGEEQSNIRVGLPLSRKVPANVVRPFPGWADPLPGTRWVTSSSFTSNDREMAGDSPAGTYTFIFNRIWGTGSVSFNSFPPSERPQLIINWYADNTVTDVKLRSVNNPNIFLSFKTSQLPGVFFTRGSFDDIGQAGIPVSSLYRAFGVPGGALPAVDLEVDVENSQGESGNPMGLDLSAVLVDNFIF
jgi:hypothetical protein